MKKSNIFVTITLLILIQNLNADWQYRRMLSIAPADTILTNYQLQLLLTPDNFDYAHSVGDSGQDLRFSTDGTGQTAPDVHYWIEEWNENDTSKVWIKVPSISDVNTTTVYMYYGNSTAASASNGDSTFIFFDDFNDGTYTNKWLPSKVSGSTGATFSETSGVLTFTNCCQNYVYCSEGPAILFSNDSFLIDNEAFTLDVTFSIATSSAGHSAVTVNLTEAGMKSDPQGSYDRRYGVYGNTYGTDKTIINYPPEYNDIQTNVVNYTLGGRYRHIVTYNGSTGAELKIFNSNNKLVGSRSDSYSYSDSAHFNLYFQVHSPGSTIDEIKIYKSSSTDPKISINTAETSGTWFLNPSTLAHWTFDEMSGDTLHDVSGNENHGVITGATWAAGNSSRGTLSFDGNNDYVLVPTIDIDNHDFTLESIVWIDNLDSNRAIYTNGTKTGAYDDGIRLWGVNINADYVFSVERPSGSGTISVDANIQTGRWYHLSIVGNYQADSLYMYINKKLFGVLSASTIWNHLTSSGNHYIGCNLNGDNSSYNKVAFFNGYIDEIRISNAALTPDQFLEFTPQNSNLVAYYPFNGNANDESGNGNDGTENGGVTLTNDRFGNANSAYNFDGVDDYITINNSSSLQFNEMSVSSWVRIDEDSIAGGIIHQNRNGSTNENNGNWRLLVQSDGAIRFDVYLPNSLNAYHSTIPGVSPRGTWNHIIATNDGNTIRLFLNNVMVLETSEYVVTGPVNDPIEIGRSRHNDVPDYYFHGAIDDIRIFNRVLSTDEIDSLYHLGGWDNDTPGTVTDYDGNVYQTVVIGNQEWMAENLKVTHYRKGDPIPTGYSNSAWSSLSTGAYAVYDDNPSNADTYGLLYNWYAVGDSRNIAPVGWHIPTDDEWKELEMFLGMDQTTANDTYWRGTDEGKKLKSSADWNGTNDFYFSAIPSGYRDYENGQYDNGWDHALYWSSTEDGVSFAWYRVLNSTNDNMYRFNFYKRHGYSVRCVRDSVSAIALSCGEVSGSDTVLVPINVQFPTSASYSSAEFTINGYQSGLSFIDVVTDGSLTGDAGWTYSANTTGDSLLVTWLAGSQAVTGNGVFCWLKFVATGEGCTYVPVTITSAVFDTGSDPVNITNGGVNIEPIPNFGDTDENGILQAYDASMILKHLVGLDSLNCQGLTNAEVSCNDTITAYDASLILQKGVGLIDSLPWCEPLLAAGEVSVANVFTSTGELFDFPIFISNGENFLSYEGIVKFNNEQITLTGITSPDGDSLSDSLIPGELHFAGASATAHNGDESFVVLQFTTGTNFSGQTEITVEKLRLNENPVIELAATASVVLGIGGEAGIPTDFALHQNYPNPFNPVTTLGYDLPEQSLVKITIYDLLGREIKTLVNQIQDAGYRSLNWNGTDNFGKPVSAGIYLYQIQAGDFVRTKKMLLLK